jgi:hypothetical protein
MRGAVRPTHDVQRERKTIVSREFVETDQIQCNTKTACAPPLYVTKYIIQVLYAGEEIKVQFAFAQATPGVVLSMSINALQTKIKFFTAVLS